MIRMSKNNDMYDTGDMSTAVANPVVKRDTSFIITDTCSSKSIINSDYSIGDTHCRNLKGAKRGMASANLTAFQHIEKDENFWMIDADDTLFLTRDFDSLREKLCIFNMPNNSLIMARPI